MRQFFTNLTLVIHFMSLRAKGTHVSKLENPECETAFGAKKSFQTIAHFKARSALSNAVLRTSSAIPKVNFIASC